MSKAFRFIVPGLLVALLTTGCEQQGATEAPENNAGSVDMSEVITELVIVDVVEGDGAVAEPGRPVVVHYTGWLYEPAAEDNKGSKFDSSVDRGQPFVFPLGGGRVIKGWDEGVAGMKVGGKRTLIIPPHKAYGAAGAGAVIPPNATLVFDVELLEIQ